MSLELFAFVDQIPSTARWQDAIHRTGVDLRLSPTLQIGRDDGFSPCAIEGRPSGFELSTEPSAEVLKDYPSLVSIVGGRSHAICFRWGGELLECACVLGATLALVQGFDAVAYYPSDDLEYDAERLVQELRDCLTTT